MAAVEWGEALIILGGKERNVVRVQKESIGNGSGEVKEGSWL